MLCSSALQRNQGHQSQLSAKLHGVERPEARARQGALMGQGLTYGMDFQTQHTSAHKTSN